MSSGLGPASLAPGEGEAPGPCFPLGQRIPFQRRCVCFSVTLSTRPGQGDSGEAGIFSQGPSQLLHQVSLLQRIS